MTGRPVDAVVVTELVAAAVRSGEGVARRWRHDDEPLPGFTVTTDGQVISYRRGFRHELAQRQKEDRYLTVQLWIGTRSCVRKVHSLVAGAFLPAPPSAQHVVRHLNGNMLDNRATNLGWGTRRDNMDDAVRHGSMCRGERVRTAVLTEGDVRHIHRLAGEGLTNVQIAGHIGKPRRLVYNVVAGKTWRHLAPTSRAAVTS